MEIATIGFFTVQALASAVLLGRLAGGGNRLPPLKPARLGSDLIGPNSITVLIPARNEENRIRDCLQAVIEQGDEVSEIVIVDDQSTDRTLAVIGSVSDPRLRVVCGRPLPDGWVGKAWALEQGLRAVRTQWVLCLDADAKPRPGLVGAALTAALEEKADALSVGPRLVVDTIGQRWLHPALLTTLIYRLGPGDTAPKPAKKNPSRRERRLVSGQCFLFRTAVLRHHGGFGPVKDAFAEDHALAAYLLGQGAQVSFRNGAAVLEIKMYSSLKETWHGWGVSLGLNEITTPVQWLTDMGILALTQAAPLPVLLLIWFCAGAVSGWLWLLTGLNGMLLVVRLSVLWATAGSYKPAADAYWLSPLADIPAVLRILVSGCTRSKTWRGRRYKTLRRGAPLQ